MSIVLDTPAQISMWVLLSRRHQIKMHLAGFPVKGLAACLKREFPGQGRYVKDFVVPVEFAISEAGGDVDYRLVNAHIMIRTDFGLMDMGVFNHPDDARTDETFKAFQEGNLECVLTTDPVREPNGKYYM